MADRDNRGNLFSQLTKLFKSGPTIRRKVREPETRVAGMTHASSGMALLSKSQNGNFGSAIAGAPYVTQDRTARLVDFNEMEQCLAGSTKIAVPGGFKTIEELHEEFGLDEEFIVYSYDHSIGKIVPAWGKQARPTKFTTAYKVTFDNGKEITGDATHRLMLRDGSYRTVDQLKAGDAMMPFKREDITGLGYKYIYTVGRNGEQGKGSNWASEHRMLAEFVSERPLTKDEVVHHIDHDRTNNSLDNLSIVDKKRHAEYHRGAAEKVNEKKWSEENSVWIAKFKREHSSFMTNNSPTKRDDVRFETILTWCDANGFFFKKALKELNISSHVMYSRLREKGFVNFVEFAKVYDPTWKLRGGATRTKGRKTLDVNAIYASYVKGDSQRELAEKLRITRSVLFTSLCVAGYKDWNDFTTQYQNCKVVSVEPLGEMQLWDLTVDGYKNFATDSVISHNTAEISSALDIYADESVAQDSNGRTLHIYSDNPAIKRTVEELLYDTLNIEFNLRPWVRNLVKYGDFFLYTDVHPKYGVINVVPIPVNELTREEGYDPNDPLAVRFRWNGGMGNRALENWEVAHMRLLGSDVHLPYGTSMLDGARKVWRQLTLLEDAVLVYRISRAAERRVFYIDVGGVAADEIPNLMEQAKTNLKSQSVVDRSTGRVDLRYNAIDVESDYFIATRGAESATKIDTLQAGQNTGNVEDLTYMQRKLVSALKVPAAYLGYNDAIPGASGLSQIDIRFSRTINMVQRTVVSELNKIVMVHLYAAGFRGEDLLNFELSLSNPSTIAQQQKLEILRTRFEIAGAAPLIGETPLMSERWIHRNVMGMSDQDILLNKRERLEDARTVEALEAAAALANSGGSAAETGGETEPASEEPASPEAPANEETPELQTASDREPSDDQRLVLDADATPVKLAPHLKNALYNRRRNLRRRSNGFAKVDTRAVSGATARPTVPESFSLRDAFDDVLIENGDLHEADDATPDRISVRPVYGLMEANMFKSMEDRLNLQDNNVEPLSRMQVLSERLDGSSKVEQHDDLADFELYVEIDDELGN